MGRAFQWSPNRKCSRTCRLSNIAKLSYDNWLFSTFGRDHILIQSLFSSEIDFKWPCDRSYFESTTHLRHLHYLAVWTYIIFGFAGVPDSVVLKLFSNSQNDVKVLSESLEPRWTHRLTFTSCGPLVSISCHFCLRSFEVESRAEYKIALWQLLAAFVGKEGEEKKKKVGLRRACCILMKSREVRFTSRRVGIRCFFFFLKAGFQNWWNRMLHSMHVQVLNDVSRL